MVKHPEDEIKNIALIKPEVKQNSNQFTLICQIQPVK